MEQITHRKCNRCGFEKPVSEMVPSRKYKGGYMPTCKPCRAAYYKALREYSPERRKKAVDATTRSKMLRAYRMSAANYERMVNEQGGKCKLCRAEDHGRSYRFKFWNIDHDHATGRVRGLLCHMCNITLGKYENLVAKVGREKIDAYLAPPKTED